MSPAVLAPAELALGILFDGHGPAGVDPLPTALRSGPGQGHAMDMCAGAQRVRLYRLCFGQCQRWPAGPSPIRGSLRRHGRHTLLHTIFAQLGPKAKGHSYAVRFQVVVYYLLLLLWIGGSKKKLVVYSRMPKNKSISLLLLSSCLRPQLACARSTERTITLAVPSSCTTIG